MRIVLPMKAVSWNQLARKHYRVYQKTFLEWKEATFYALKVAKATPVPTPVRITATAHFKGKRRHDIDNLCIKMILDQFVASKIILDDSTEYVKEIILRGEIGAKEDCLEVCVETI